MGSSIRISTPTNIQYNVDTAFPGEQCLGVLVVQMAVGLTSAIYTSPNGTPPISMTRIAAWNKTALTGSGLGYSMYVNGAIYGASQSFNSSGLNGSNVNASAPQSTAVVVLPGQIVQGNITGTSPGGTVVFAVFGAVWPL